MRIASLPAPVVRSLFGLAPVATLARPCMILRDLLRVLGSADRRDGRNLTHDEAYRAFLTILDGEESEIRIGAFLIALRWKGVTVDEVTGFARAARERATIPCQAVEGLVCICPPHDGYDLTPPLEVAAGLVAAGAGAKVLLVIDRGVPPKRGITGAHVLEHLGAPMSWDPAEAERAVKNTGFGAIAAPGMLPALLGLRRVRGDVGVRTPLSTVEKLIVPPKAAILLGSNTGPVLGLAAGTMAGLGHTSGIAIQGVGGGPIPSLTRRTRDDGRSARTRAAAHSGRYEQHMGAVDVRCDLRQSFLGRGLADFWPRARPEAFGQAVSELDLVLCLRSCERLHVGVRDDEFHAAQAGRHHVVDGVTTGAPDADRDNPRFSVDQLCHVEATR